MFSNFPAGMPQQRGQFQCACDSSILDGLRTALDAIRSELTQVWKAVTHRKPHSGGNGRYDDEAMAYCVACVEAAKGVVEIRVGAKSKCKMMLDDVFLYFREKLKAFSVETSELFQRIVHAFRCRQSRKNKKKVEALQDEARRKAAERAKNERITPIFSEPETPVHNKPDFGITPAMKPFAKIAASVALATTCATAAPLRSEASGTVPDKLASETILPRTGSDTCDAQTYRARTGVGVSPSKVAENSE